MDRPGGPGDPRTTPPDPFGDFDDVYDSAARLRSSTNFGGKPAYDQTLSYNAAGSIASKIGKGTYVYGADGARLRSTVSGSTTLTIGPIEVRGHGSGSETLILIRRPGSA